MSIPAIIYLFLNVLAHAYYVGKGDEAMPPQTFGRFGYTSLVGWLIGIIPLLYWGGFFSPCVCP